MKSKDYPKLIPASSRITRTTRYEIVWTDEFIKDDKQLGECRYDTKQILISKNQSPTEQFKTYLHEIIHAIDLETEGPNLTERQVRKMEEGFFRWLKLNGYLERLGN